MSAKPLSDLSVMMITADFPPDSSPGAIRNAAFANRLVERLSKLHVATEVHAPFGAKPTWKLAALDQDFTAVRHATSDQSVSRIQRAFAKVKFYLDATYAGIDSLIDLVKQTHRDHPLDLIYASCNPLSVGVAGYELKRALNVPLIVELRDPWMENPFRRWPTAWHYWSEKRLSEKVFATADALIMNSPTARDMILKANPGLSPDCVHVVPHGYDLDRFGGLGESKEATAKEKFSIGYSGGFYSTCTPYVSRSGLRKFLEYSPFQSDEIDLVSSSPKPLFDAVKLIESRREDLKDKIQLRFLASLKPADEQYVREQGLGDNVVVLPRRKPSEVPAFIEECTAMYLTNPIFPELRSPFISTKTIEYLATGKPVIVFLSDSDNRDIPVDAGVGFAAESTSTEALADVIESLADQHFSGGIQMNPDPTYIGHFDRARHTHWLSEIFLQATGNAQKNAVLTEAFQ